MCIETFGRAKFKGEGRSPQEGAETSCRARVGMPGAATFTLFNQTRNMSGCKSVEPPVEWVTQGGYLGEWRRGRDLKPPQAVRLSGLKMSHLLNHLQTIQGERKTHKNTSSTVVRPQLSHREGAGRSRPRHPLMAKLLK